MDSAGETWVAKDTSGRRFTPSPSRPVLTIISKHGASECSEGRPLSRLPSAIQRGASQRKIRLKQSSTLRRRVSPYCCRLSPVVTREKACVSERMIQKQRLDAGVEFILRETAKLKQKHSALLHHSPNDATLRDGLHTTPLSRPQNNQCSLAALHCPPAIEASVPRKQSVQHPSVLVCIKLPVLTKATANSEE